MGRAVMTVLVACLALPIGCGTTETARRPSEARLAGVNRLAVVAEGADAFEVLSARVKTGEVHPVVIRPTGLWGGGGGGLAGLSAAAAGALAELLVGLTTLAISTAATAAAEGAAASDDASAAAALVPQDAEIVPRSLLVDTFLRTLRSGGRFKVEALDSEPSDAERQRFDAVLRLRFPRWGFLLLRSDATSMAAFVDIDVRMVPARDGDALWEERTTVLGHGRQTMEELKADPELVRRELRDVLETTGYQLAAELLYPRGAP